MKHIANLIVKLIMLPLLIVFFAVAYTTFLVSPDLNKFKFKMER